MTGQGRQGGAGPNFVGIGAQKCASTWLYDILRDHPQARLSACKELDFFSYRYDRGSQWYERQFPAADGARAVGEISPSYFHDAAAPARLRDYRPDARILVALRDPVERALSHHRHAVRVGDWSGGDLTFESALAANPSYVEQGRYATHLERWLHHFPREQLLVLFFEEIAGEPQAVAQRVYRFLGIDPGHCSASLARRSNASHVNPHRALERMRRGARLGARRLGLGPLWELAARAGARRLYRRFNRRPAGELIPPPEAQTVAALRAAFADEIGRLERLTGRDLSVWRGEGAPSAAAGAAVRQEGQACPAP